MEWIPTHVISTWMSMCIFNSNRCRQITFPNSVPIYTLERKNKHSILPCFKVWLCAWSLTASAWALLQTLAIQKLLVINFLWLKLVTSNRNQFCRRLQVIVWIYLTVLSDSRPYLGHEGLRKLCVCVLESILPIYFYGNSLIQ